MIFIIGVNHRVQYINSDSDILIINEYRKSLIENIILYSIELIGEEFSEDALRLSNGMSVTKEIADKYSIQFLFCDPGIKERKIIGYKSRDEIRKLIAHECLEKKEMNLKTDAIESLIYFPVREEFWLKKLHPYLNKNILFIIGESHLISFANLLNSRRIKSKIVSTGIGVSEEDIKKRTRINEYISTHKNGLINNYSESSFK